MRQTAPSREATYHFIDFQPCGPRTFYLTESLTERFALHVLQGRNPDRPRPRLEKSKAVVLTGPRGGKGVGHVESDGSDLIVFLIFHGFRVYFHLYYMMLMMMMISYF